MLWLKPDWGLWKCACKAAAGNSSSGMGPVGKLDSRAPPVPPPSLVCIGFSALPKCPLTSPQSVKIPKIAV